MTLPTNPYKNINGNFLEARLLGVSDVGTAVISMQESTNSCVNVIVLIPLTSLLFSVVSSSPWVIYFDLFGWLWLYPFILVVVTSKHFTFLCLEMSLIIVGLVFTGGAGTGYFLTLGYGAISVRAGVGVFFLGWVWCSSFL